MKVDDLVRCSIHEWYPSFIPYTIKTTFHPIPESFTRYILGLHQIIGHGGGGGGDDDDAPPSPPPPPPFLLPRSATGADPLPRHSVNIDDPVSSLSIIDESDSSDNDDDDSNAPSFPDLESAVATSIADLGGAVFPKLNWSAPKDAAWIAFDGTLRCTSFSDIALLLRASDAAYHDLAHALPSCSDHHTTPTLPPPTTFYLALRKWYPTLHPYMEFRCFVRHQTLVAVTQREVTAFYPQLLQRRHEILLLVQDFFNEIVQPRFESEDYTFDVYVKRNGKVKLLDFNPWGAFTLPLLFTWEELEESAGLVEDGEVEFRIVENRCGVRPGLKTAVPYDYLDTSQGSGWDQFLKRVDEEQLAQDLEEAEIC